MDRMDRDSPWFRSDETGEPFRHCIHCRLPLEEIDAPWLVTKDYRRDECVLEYAICQPCRNGLSAGFSEETKAKVRHFLETEIDWSARVSEFMMHPGLDVRLSACIACRTPREQLAGFGLSALFDPGGRLVEGPLPLILCDVCTRRLVENLTPESLASWRDFLSSHFEGPPHDPGDHPGAGYTGMI